MSQKNNRSFIEEIQEKYEVAGTRFTPPYYAEAGMIVELALKADRPRPVCPICGEHPIVHGYIKNGKSRYDKRDTVDLRNETQSL